MATKSRSGTVPRLCALLAVMVVAAACSNATPTPPPTATPAEPVTLRVYTYDQPPISSVLDILIQAFNQSHPEVTIKKEPITGDPGQQIAGMAASNSMPDVIWTIDALTPSLVEAGLLLDMRELANIDRAFKTDDINPNALTAGNLPNNPGLYMMPAVMESVQMFYNKNLFTDSGAPLPAADWTWDDMIAACKQIQDKHPDVKCLGYANDAVPEPGWWAYLAPWIRGYGGDLLSADGKVSTLSKPESLAGIQAYIDLWTRHRIANPRGQRSNCFVDQKCAAQFFILGGIKGLQARIGKTFDWDVQVMPAHPKGRFTGTATYGFGIAKSARRPELAWEFVKQLASPEVQRQIAATRAGLPVLKSLMGDAALASNGEAPVNLQAFVKGSEFGIYPPAYPTRCGNFYNGLVQTALAEATQAAISGARVETAFKAADAKIQACLDAGK